MLALVFTLSCNCPTSSESAKPVNSEHNSHTIGWRELSEPNIPARQIPDVAVQIPSFSTDSRQVVMLGLDGADWRFIKPMIETGILPNFSALLAKSAAGILKTDHGFSPTTWTTIATGKTAEKHGVGPTVKEPWDLYWLEPKDIKVRRVWEIASEAGRSVAVYNYFFCKPRPSGDWGWIPKYPLTKSEYLPEGLNLEGCTIPGDRLEQHYFEICLLGKRPTDLTIMLVKQTDEAGHNGALPWLKKWHPELFDHDADIPDFQGEDYVTRTMKQVDVLLGELMINLPKGAHLVISSDHGFAPPKADLMEFGFGKCLLDAVSLSRPQLDRDNHFIADNPIGKIDIRKETTLTEIPVAHFKNRDSVEKVPVRLERLTVSSALVFNPDWMDKLEQRIRKYLGDEIEYIDIKREGRKIILTANLNIAKKMLAENPSEITQCALSNHYFQTGHHGPGNDGILLFYGPKIQPGSRITRAAVEDVTPTILYLMGLPIGRDMDGHLLTDAIKKQTLSNNPVRFVETFETTPVKRDNISFETQKDGYTRLDAKEIERLKGLGYIQ